MTGESLICVKLLHCVLNKDIVCFSLWMRKRKWEVELPEVCLQTWKEGVKRAGTGCDQQSSFAPCAPHGESVKSSTETVWNPPRGRGAVLVWRARFSSLLLPPRSEPLMHAVLWQLLRCRGFVTIFITFDVLLCNPCCSSSPHPRRIQGSSSSPLHRPDSPSFAFLALTLV